MVHGDRAKITGINAPGAAIAFLRIHMDDAGFRVLGQRVLRAGDHAGGILAGAAGDRGDQHFIHAHGADAAAVGVVFTSFGI